MQARLRALRLACSLCAAGACAGDVIQLGAGRDAPDGGTGELSEPALIEGLAGGDGKDDDPSVSADLRLLYFNSTRSGGAGKEDIWSSRRGSSNAAWQAPEPVLELNSEDRETGIALARDGLSILFSSDRPGGSGGLDVYRAQRAHRDAAWSEPDRVADLSSSADDLVSGVGVAGSVYLARREGEDDDYDLYMALRDAAGDGWTEVVPLSGLNSDEEESDAFEVGDGALLLFTRDEDLFQARRESGSEQFGEAVPFAALNGADDDRDLWGTPDLSYVVFSSDRSGQYRLYEAWQR
jgi:WD40-like Beta Propeller Repeat